MIELPITLASGGSVCLPGRAYALALGYTKNRGVYRLAVTASGEWEGLAIRCFWHVPDGKDPASALVVDGYVAVPASVTAQPGSGCITFEGSDGTKTVTSADLRYRVSANSGTEDGTEPEPGTPAWQQLVDAVHTDATAAEQAKTDAQTAAQQSEASAKKAGQALSDTITAKEDALKAISDKQTVATQAVDTARDKALKQVEASTKAAKTAASEAATSAGNADQSAQAAAGSLQALKDGIASGDFKGEPGNDGKSPVVAVTDIENGHRVSITDKDGTKTIDVLNGQTGKTGATPVLTIGTVSSGDKPSADITGTPENPVLNLKLQPGPQGPAIALDTTLTHEGEAADAKATGDAISAVKARQNLLVGTEMGNPLSVDDAFSAPLCGLTVYGKSTQDGTPTPDAPVPIVSAGDGGSVAVKVRGKNLWDNFKTLSLGNVEQKRGAYIATTSTMQVDITPASVGARPLRLKAGNTYTFSLKTTVSISSYKFVCLKYTNGEGKNIVFANVDFVNFVPERDVENIGFILYETVAGDKVYDVQLEMGSKATSYEPYREQLLTLPTPNGLPGIPVTSGGSYTDPQGQQWVCDEVDLERGVKVQRVKVKELSPDDKWKYRKTNKGNNNFQIRIYNADEASRKKPCFCNILRYIGPGWDDIPQNLPKIYANEQEITISFPPNSEYSSLEAFKQLLTDVKSVIYYALTTPIETPLTPAEIAAYKALTAYGPDTVVQASDGAGVKLDYQRDVNIAIKKLEDAIASMTTT